MKWESCPGCLRQTYCGQVHRLSWWQFTAGSRAEGLALERRWGHKQADRDNMCFYGGPWGVHVPNSDNRNEYELTSSRHQSADESTKLKSRRFSSAKVNDPGYLVLDSADCPPAHYRIRVAGDPKSLASMMGKSASWGVLLGAIGKARASQCFIEKDGQIWLSSYHAMRALVGLPEDEFARVCGPAGKIGPIDAVPALLCSHPLPCMTQYCLRKRSSHWPRENTVHLICDMCGVLVPTGHKASKKPIHDLEWRASFSLQETALAKDMPLWIKQGLWAFKYTLKHTLCRDKHLTNMRMGRLCSVNCTWSELCENQSAEGQEGRSKIGSYHMKTTLLWELEEPAVWGARCPFKLLMNLLNRMLGYLQNGSMPHYFIPQCDLLQCVSSADQLATQECINQILTNPIPAIIMSPSSPKEIFGPMIKGDLSTQSELADTFCSAIANVGTPQFVEDTEKLQSLLEGLDQQKRKTYQKQCKRDKHLGIKDRPPLLNLVTMLHHVCR